MPALLVPFGPVQEALQIADLGAETTGEHWTDTGDGGQAEDGWVELDFGGDPARHLVDLAFEEADVGQGYVQDALDGQGQGRGEGKSSLATRCSLRAMSMGCRR